MKESMEDNSRNLYSVLYEAIHSETGEELVIYKDDNDRIWAKPKSLLSDYESFTKVKQKENNNSKLYNTSFINNYSTLKYTSDIPKLKNEEQGFSSSVKSMITLLSNRNLVDKNIFLNLKNDDDLEHLIFNKIESYKDGDDLEQIFHLIQTWGGSTGRGIYIHGNKFDWNTIEKHYKCLVNDCISITSINEYAINKIFNSVESLYYSVKHMGVAFITKHTRYWMYKSVKYDALPIYDSIMAKFIMKKNSAEINQLKIYWNTMYEISKEKDINLMSLERQIFKVAYQSLRNRSY